MSDKNALSSTPQGDVLDFETWYRAKYRNEVRLFTREELHEAFLVGTVARSESVQTFAVPPDRVQVVRDFLAEMLSIARNNGLRSSVSDRRSPLDGFVALGDRQCLEDAIAVIDEFTKPERLKKIAAFVDACNPVAPSAGVAIGFPKVADELGDIPPPEADRSLRAAARRLLAATEGNQSDCDDDVRLLAKHALSVDEPGKVPPNEFIAAVTGWLNRWSPDHLTWRMGDLYDRIVNAGYKRTPPSAREESKLDKPAQVGNTIFGAGISERTVIERAQREHDYRQRPESEAVRISLSNNAFRNLHLEVALAELVELKGMKDALDDHHAGVNQLDDWYAIEQDYKLRKPRAWQRARELLAPGASLGPTATSGEHG